MLTLNIPELGDAPLFEAILEPTVTTVNKLAKNKDMGEGEINTFRGRKNKIAVGVPYYENLVSKLLEEKVETPHEIKRMLDDYDFHFVSLSCSFLPDSNCRFTWARFGAELSAWRRDSEEPLEERPIAYDMFPDEVLSEIAYRRSILFKPELKFDLGMPITVSPGEISRTREMILYEPQIFAYGIGRPNISWDFKATSEKGIWGNKRNLLLVVKTLKNSRVKGRFLLGAEIELHIGKWIRIPLTRREDELIDADYNLSS